MTLVEGPPVPLERFSSLPMRGRDGRDAAATGRSMLEVSCDMAQVFDIPMGNRKAARWMLSCRSRGFLSVQIAYSSQLDPSGSLPWEYGSATRPAQAPAFPKTGRSKQGRFLTRRSP